ncbi:uncharacterized protein LOC141588662 [Silene latifolia]|uniref:uncharacterized protein LOC141588662 n=1 Tax=Silene latifolia TaxID=37657 RepID=UPI003D77BBC4
MVQKLLIFFEQLEVDYVLFSDCPEVPEDSDQTSKLEIDKINYEKHNELVRGQMLSHMSNPIFDLFTNNKYAKSIWETLEKKYGADDAGKKKYVVGKWINFQMVEVRPIMDQVHEYENLVADILSEGMKMCEVLQANVLIQRLLKSWDGYRNHLKHKKKDLTLEDLIGYLKIEKANKLQEKV